MERSKQPVNNTPDREAVMRDKRAQGIAAMGLAVREGEIFKVTEPSLRGRRTTHDVWRHDSGKIRCTCADFNQESKTNADYRCVHQLAVKHHLLRKTAPGGVPDGDTDILATELRPTTHPEGSPEMNSKAPQTAAGGEHSAAVIPITFTNTLRTLRQPVDPKLIKTREGWTDRQGNKHMVEYVEWHAVADILDRVAPTWSHAVRNITQIGGMVAVTAAIIIDGVTREGIGTGNADNETGIKKAEHDALKRAAIKFGIARELYQRESDVVEGGGSGTGGYAQSTSFPRDPLAKSMADLVTPKQLGMIRALAREAGVDMDEECQQQMRCRAEELSKKAASALIDRLKGLQQQGGAAAGGVRRAG